MKDNLKVIAILATISVLSLTGVTEYLTSPVGLAFIWPTTLYLIAKSPKKGKQNG